MTAALNTVSSRACSENYVHACLCVNTQASPAESRGRWPPSRPSRKSQGRNQAWPGCHYRNGWCLEHTHTRTHSQSIQSPKYHNMGRKQTNSGGDDIIVINQHYSSQLRSSTPLKLTVEPGNGNDFKQDHSDDCRACSVLLKQLHHKCSSLT